MSINFTPIARIKAESAERYVVEWNVALLAEREFVRADLEARLDRLVGDRAKSVQWG